MIPSAVIMVAAVVKRPERIGRRTGKFRGKLDGFVVHPDKKSCKAAACAAPAFGKNRDHSAKVGGKDANQIAVIVVIV
jgi:uncharacterized protein with PIN domain